MQGDERRLRFSRRHFLRTGAVATTGLAVGGLATFDAIRSRAGAQLTLSTERSRSSAPQRLAELKPVLQELVAEMERHVPYASAVGLRRRITQFAIDDNTREIQDLFPSEGVVFRIHNGAWFEESATDSLDPDQLRRAALELATAAKQNPVRSEIDPGEGGERHFRTQCTIDPRGMQLEERLERAAALHRRARSVDAKLINCQVDVTERIDEEVFVNRAKSWSQDLLRMRCDLGFYVTDGRRTTANFEGGGGSGGLELIAIPDDALATAARDAHILLRSGPIDPGIYEVVVRGDVAGTLAHESFGHGVELDMFVKDRALAEQFLSKRVGSDLVNIVDDPSLPKGFGSYFFDHEGQPAAPTAIVENGIFVRGISDLMSAQALAVERTAHGRRQDFTRKAYARMSNTFFKRGAETVASLISGVKHGFLLEKLTHGMEDPKGWGILLGVHIGREIRDGRLTGRIVTPVGVTGYVPDVLGSVDGVANDFTTDPGMCGKGHKEYVPVSTGGPHIRFTARLS